MKKRAAFCIAIQVIIFFNKPLSAEADKKCDIFQKMNVTTGQCVCRQGRSSFGCQQQELPVGTCMTYNESTDRLTIGQCPYHQLLDGNITLDLENFKIIVLVHSGEDLNNAMCGHLNRTGFLCGRCKQKNGVAVYSKSLECIHCSERNEVWMWVLYLALETVPIFLVFAIITIFNIRGTSPPYTSFLFHNQFISFINSIGVYKVLIGYGADETLYRVTMTVLDIWNLDALRHIIPLFCVSSSLSNFQVQLMRTVSSLFPLLLVFISYLLIELHGRNCKILVLLWKPFNKCISRLRRSWDPRSSNIAAFSTIITLSLLKVWSSTLYLIYPNSIHYKGNTTNKYLYIDPYMEIDKITSLPFFWPLTLILGMATLLPTLILCLYPTRVCRRLFFCCKTSKFQSFRYFAETFQGHYKDGTNGTRDYRAASSLVFILRILASVSLYPETSRGGSQEHTLSIVMVYILISTSLFYAIAQPCKKRYMNNIESVLYALTAISYLAIVNANLKPRAEKRDLRLAFSTITLVLLLSPSIVLFVKIIFVNTFLRLFKKNQTIYQENQFDALPDRAICSTEHTQLVQKARNS